MSWKTKKYEFKKKYELSENERIRGGNNQNLDRILTPGYISGRIPDRYPVTGLSLKSE